MPGKVTINYIAEPTARAFHHSNAFVRGVLGPVRSGKSTMCCQEIFRRAREQQPHAGKRRTRWVVIRNTYRELEDTTLKTWLDWWDPDYFGRFNHGSMIHPIRFKEKDGSTVELEVMFRALDKPKDIAKLLSMEVTGAWINEAREVPKAVVDTTTDRVGQYPALKDGGCTWAGVIMDTNPPDEDHWWYETFEEDRPANWRLFRQPGALVEREGAFVPNRQAENIGNLNEGIHYYLKRLGGKSKDYIRVYYCGQYGFVIEGKPVHPDYVDATHCTHEIIRPIPRIPLVIGLDFGLTPAAIFMQKYPNGRWVWIDELVTMNSSTMGATRFGEALVQKLASEYRGMKYTAWGDPAGDERTQTDEQTVYQVLEKAGITARPVFTQDVTIRRDAIDNPLRRLIDGKPGLMVSPKCKITRKGLAGGFAYRRIQVSGPERYHLEPDKNMYSHPVEAGEYGLVGGGEGHKVITPDFRSDPQPKVEYDELAY